MSPWTRIAVSLLAAALFLTGPRAKAAAPFHIGLVTSTIEQGEDAYRGAERLERDYGSAKSGGAIIHLTCPGILEPEQETYIARVVLLADDPQLKAIVANPAFPGTAEAFRKVHAKRPDILCLVGEAKEEPSVICPTADLVANQDFIS